MSNQFTLSNSEFPREFASFVDFVGGDGLEKALRKVMRKLSPLDLSTRTLFGDRYFFHEQCIRFIDGPTSFQLDASDRFAIRAASLIAGINRVRAGLSPAANSRFRKMCLDGLKPDRDIRQIEHEIRCFTHFGQKGFDVAFADLEGKGRFDLLCVSQAGTFEVECKTVSESTGSQIKPEMTVNLSQAFKKASHHRLPANESGIFILTLKKPADNCKNLVEGLKAALGSSDTLPSDGTDFTLAFVPRPNWSALIKSGVVEQLRSAAPRDSELKGHAYCVTKVGDCAVALVLRPHKPSTLSEKIVAVLKEAADQCSRLNACLVWLHFIGLAEEEFLRAAEFSMQGSGAGLNAIVANTLSPRAPSTDRGHVRLVRFSADAAGITTRPILDPTLLMVKAASVSGTCYDVPNPYCRFETKIDF